MDDHSKTDEQTLIQPIEGFDPVHVEQTPSLLMISGAQIGRSFPILHEEFMIGRASSCDLSIEEDLVSRHHCKIVLKPDGAELIDLGSTNGTLINGRKLEGPTRLNEADQVQVGSTTILKYHLQEEVEAKFFSQLFDAATRDFLTNTYNKKFFIERIQDEFSFAQRHDRRLSVLILDIDHFKSVNDTYGHLAGDIAIKKVAHHIMTHTRKDDIVARFGGEEFVILMRDVEASQAQHLAEQLRKGISEVELKSGARSFRVTVSVGVASLDVKNKSNFVHFDRLIEFADKKLYEAKSSGRNRVCA